MCSVLWMPFWEKICIRAWGSGDNARTMCSLPGLLWRTTNHLGASALVKPSASSLAWLCKREDMVLQDLVCRFVYYLPASWESGILSSMGVIFFEWISLGHMVKWNWRGLVSVSFVYMCMSLHVHENHICGMPATSWLGAFMCIIPLNSHDNPEPDLLIPILQMRKWRLGGLERLGK